MNSDIVVIGDISLDWCSSYPLPFSFAEIVDGDGKASGGKINELPGGTGLNFAKFAQEFGYNPLLLGKIGNDISGRFIYKWLEKRGLQKGVSLIPSISTGKVIIVRDKNNVRLMIDNDEENANSYFSMADVEEYAENIKSCKALYISGYCFSKPKSHRTKATVRAIELAKSGYDSQIIFDVVPHEFYKRYSFIEFLELTKNVSIIVSQLSTIRRFLNIGNKAEIITRDLAEETVEYLSNYYDRFMLRFGATGLENQVIWDSKKKYPIWQQTDFEQISDRRGLGDKLTIKTIKNVFKVKPGIV